MGGQVWKRTTVVGPRAVIGLDVVGYGWSAPEKCIGPCHHFFEDLTKCPNPYTKFISGNASSRETAMFWSLNHIKRVIMNQAVEAAWFEKDSFEHLQSLVFDLSVKLGLAKNVHCYLPMIGFALFRPNMAPVTCVRFAILSLRKWPLPNQSKHPPYSKMYKTCADLSSTTWKNSSKNQLLRKWFNKSV